MNPELQYAAGLGVCAMIWMIAFCIGGLALFVFAMIKETFNKDRKG